MTLGDSLVAFAKTFEGLPYKVGGCTDTEGFDCSGLVNFTFAAFNLNVGRSSRDQHTAGFAVPVEQALPGDIITFARKSGKKQHVFHAGLIVTNTNDSLVMIHANQRFGVHQTNVFDSMYWLPKIASIRRVERTPRP